MRGMVFRFECFVAFVDGTKQNVFRPTDVEVQEDRFDVYESFNVYAIRCWQDVFGTISCLDKILERGR